MVVSLYLTVNDIINEDNPLGLNRDLIEDTLNNFKDDSHRIDFDNYLVSNRKKNKDTSVVNIVNNEVAETDEHKFRGDRPTSNQLVIQDELLLSSSGDVVSTLSRFRADSLSRSAIVSQPTRKRFGPMKCFVFV